MRTDAAAKARRKARAEARIPAHQCDYDRAWGRPRCSCGWGSVARGRDAVNAVAAHLGDPAIGRPVVVRSISHLIAGRGVLALRTHREALVLMDDFTALIRRWPTADFTVAEEADSNAVTQQCVR